MDMDCLPPLRSRTGMGMANLRLRETHIMATVSPTPGPSTSFGNAPLEVKDSLRLLATPTQPSGYFSKLLSKTSLDTTSTNKSLLRSCFTVVTDLKSPSTKNNNTTTTNKMTMDWYCSRDGILDLFKGLDLTDVENPVNKPDVSLFRLVSDQAPNLPRHILKWGEAKNNDIVIWSIQEARASNTSSQFRIAVPTKRRRGMRGHICKLMTDLASGKGYGRELAKSFQVIKVKEEAREAVWHLVRRTKANPGITTKQFEACVTPTSTE
ncbi:hypothetical protein EDB81DRAFT_853783 [Dactylonectria macrodidyma]|uniref:Uncharacterized protein n=1 Tax=Dactylonectria macrodidyma TaxID=307937 RepID=A0A9P9FI53_9HYPO|nr:hypothetical protein EDB81DRAFT_853783 [Dactylonectria macrodidyma]